MPFDCFGSCSLFFYYSHTFIVSWILSFRFPFLISSSAALHVSGFFIFLLFFLASLEKKEATSCLVRYFFPLQITTRSCLSSGLSSLKLCIDQFFCPFPPLSYMSFIYFFCSGATRFLLSFALKPIPERESYLTRRRY